MAWSVAGVGRRTQHAAEEAARRAGKGIGEWLDEAIAERAAEQGARAVEDEVEDDRWDAVSERLQRISRRNRRAEEPQAILAEDVLGSAIERFEKAVLRNEERSIRALESVAHLLERASGIADRDWRVQLDGTHPPEAIDRRLSRGSVKAAEARDEGLVGQSAFGSDAGRRFDQRMDEIARRIAGVGARRGPEAAPANATRKQRLDLKTAVSQIVMRREELNARGGERASADAPDERKKLGAEEIGARASAAAPVGTFDSGAPADARSVPPEALRDDILNLAGKLDDMRREHADQHVSAANVNALRAEIAAMSRSLAGLAPRNAVLALESAIHDLVQRVSAMRDHGHGELLLAPLETMAAELRAALKAHDPQTVAAGLEREIRAIGGKIDGLAESAIKPESFERIRQQTEEVSNLLAAAALRTAPLERLERQIGELADRVEQLGASPAPHTESARLAASLADARAQIERSTPPAALIAIEQRLEQIAARLDLEIARPAAQATIDPRPFEDLARRIEGVRQSMEARPKPQIDLTPIERLLRDFDAKLDAASHRDGAVRALESLLAEISHKLDRPQSGQVSPQWLEPILSDLSARLDLVAVSADTGPIEASLRELHAKFDANGPPNGDPLFVEHVADQVARRLLDRNPGQIDTDALAEQIATIHDRIDELTAKAENGHESEQVARELLDRLRDVSVPPGTGASGTPSEIGAAVAAHLADLRAEQSNADQRTQSRLTGLQDVLDKVVARLANIETEITGDVADEVEPSPGAAISRTSGALPGVEALGTRDSPNFAPQRMLEARLAAAADDESVSPSVNDEDFLLEPGAGAPQRAQEDRDLAHAIGSKSNPALGAHIAAARRAAQAALPSAGRAAAQGGTILTSEGQVRLAARSVEQAKAFYGAHKRTVLLGVALLIAATLAVRLVGLGTPFLQKSELDGGPVKTAQVGATFEGALDRTGEPKSISEAKPASRPIDETPTAAIPTAPAKPTDVSTPQANPALPQDLLAAIPAGISQPLRDAIVAGAPGAQYELAQRLFEGRALSKDQQAAAIWFERAASLGLAPAQYRIAALYEKGIGVARDAAAAKHWYLKAAEAGNVRAAHNLAVMIAQSGDEKPDYFEAAKWFRKAGELGVRDSQFNLAILYARGLGVEQDLRQSWLWFSLAAQQGDTDAAKKRDEVAAKMDPASLAAATDALAKFKVSKPNPLANEVATPPGGWDARPGASPSAPTTPAVGGGARPQTAL